MARVREPMVDVPESAHLEAIEEHIRRFIGEPAYVMHEIISDLVHIDVHVVEPNNQLSRRYPKEF